MRWRAAYLRPSHRKEQIVPFGLSGDPDVHKTFLSWSGTSCNMEGGASFIKRLIYKSILPPQCV